MLDGEGMSTPITISIPLSEIEEWQRRIKEAMPPNVRYGEEGQMLKQAYEERGNVLYYLNHRLATFNHLAKQE